jgi:adenine deaminase
MARPWRIEKKTSFDVTDVQKYSEQESGTLQAPLLWRRWMFVEQRSQIIDVALGVLAPDLVLRNANLINVFTREILLSDIAIKCGLIATVRAAGTSEWPAAPVEDLDGRIVSPGFIDPHVHIESSFLTVSEYSKIATAHGVTLIAADPHEMGNVLGIPGMKLMLEEAKSVALRVRYRVPARIPAMPAWLETAGAAIDLSETIDMLDWPEAICLAGDINPFLLVNKDQDQLEKIGAARARRMTAAGQAPGLLGIPLDAYVAAGPEDSHAAASVPEILEDQRRGLRSIVALRRHRLYRKEFAELAKLIDETNIDTRYLQFCTDDVNAHELIDDGHLDRRVRIAIEEGMDPMIAYQMATINVAEALRVHHEYGAVAPGRAADLIVLGDIRKVDVEATMIGGRWVYKDGAVTAQATAAGVPFEYPAWSKETMRVAAVFTAADMGIASAGPGAMHEVRSINTFTPKSVETFHLPEKDGLIVPDPEQGVSSIIVIDRHTASGRSGKGFVSGLYVKRGAFASTVAHDAHNLLIIGANHHDMAIAANRAVANGGGYVIVCDGEIITELPLPVAGLMSLDPIDTVAASARRLIRAMHDSLGAPDIDQVLHMINFLPLPNIPNNGFTDFGLIATNTMELVPTLVGVG